jgi:hypothetical protein
MRMIKGDDLARWEYWYSTDRLAEGDRKFESDIEWDNFVKAVGKGDAVARAHKQFPYKARRPAEEWEVEREYWFEWPSEPMKYVVVHAHSKIKWDDRKTCADALEFILQVNVRHCTSNKEFSDTPSSSRMDKNIQGDTEKRGFQVFPANAAAGEDSEEAKFPDGLEWRKVADNDPNQDIRDVIGSGEGTFNFTKAAHRGADRLLAATETAEQIRGVGRHLQIGPELPVLYSQVCWEQAIAVSYIS